MKNKNIDISLLIGSLILIIFVVAAMALNPEQANSTIYSIFGLVTNNLGTFMLWFGFISFIYCLVVAVKFGKIKLGEGKPEFSLFQYLSMMICAGLGSACVIWSFVEWAFYYAGPALGIEASSPLAAEYATAYNFYHWGFIPWAMFMIATIPVAYAFHVRKIPALRFSSICEAMMGERPYTKVVGKFIDFVFVFCVVGGLGVTLGLGIPVIAGGLGTIFGFTPTFTTNIIVTIAIAAIFSLSSYVGIEKGMKKLSTINIYAAIVFIIALLVTGPTIFILKQITNGVGIMLQDFIRISLNTDPVNNGGFPEGWTIFFIAFGIVYATLMALFITKVSRGRTIGEMIYSVIFGGSIGCFVFFGINGSYSMSLQLTGELDVVDVLFSQGNAATIMEVLSHTPFGILSVIIFVVITILFLATTLDSAAFSLSATSTKVLSEDGNTSPMLRLFWCVTLALVPLCMNYIGASLNALQTLTIVTSLPFIVVIILMTKGWFRWLKEDGYR